MKTHFDHIYQLATVSSRASVLGIPTRDTHFTRDLGMGIPKTRGYPNHRDSANTVREHVRTISRTKYSQNNLAIVK